MSLREFETELYFEKSDFEKPCALSASDCQSITIEELLHLSGGSSSELLNLSLGYSRAIGNRELRGLICDQYHQINPCEVILLGAPIEGIFLGINSILSESDHAICLSPAYDALYNVACNTQADVDRWFLTEKNGQWNLDFESLRKLVKPNTKLLILNFPHNPTGFIPTLEDLQKIVSFAREHDLWIFADEIYFGMVINENDHLPRMADVYDKCISLSGMSKAQGLPGLRLGWLTVKDRSTYRDIINHKHYTSHC